MRRSSLPDWLLFAGVWAAAALVLALAGLAFQAPGFMDAYYYFHVAANLAAGRGLTEDVIWNYLAPPAAVTHPSNLYWMPLASAITAPFLALFGETFRAAQLPAVLVAAIVPAATAVVARRRLGSTFKAVSAAGLALFCGYYFVYWGAIDSFGVYALTAGAVFLATGAMRDAATPRRAAALGAVAGAATAVAHLARADGPLLLAAGALPLLWPGGDHAPLRRVGLAAAVGAYALGMAPWLLRNVVVAGSPLPGGGLSTMLLTDYNEIFSYQTPITLEHYLAQGWGPLLAGKWTAAYRNLGVLFGLEYWLIPFALAGWWRLRRWAPLGPALTYGVLLYLAMTLLFTFPSGRGSMLHSGVALVPWLAIAAVQGVEVAVVWVAARLPHWNPPVATRNFTLIFVAISAAMCAYLTAEQARDWQKQVDGYRGLAAAIAGPAPVVMTLNPPGWWWVTRQPAIQTPSDGPAAALAAAARYGATHLVLEPARSLAWQDFDPGHAEGGHFQRVAEREGFTLFTVRP